MVTQRKAVGAPTRVIGKKGLKNLGGRIQEEYLALFKSWTKESQTYIEMRDDIIIGTLLDAIKLPLLAAPFDVEAGGSEPADEEAKDFLQQNIDRMVHQSWRSYIQDALEAIDFGFAVGEIVLEKRDDGRLWLRNIDPRGQESLEEWKFDEFDQVEIFVQRDPNTGQRIEIPIRKCVHITFRGRKGNPQGRSLLRSVYRPWRFLKDLENLEGIGVERDVGSMPVATMPEEPLSKEDKEYVEDALESIRVDEQMYLIVPHGMEVKPYAASGSKMFDIDKIIQRYSKQILMRAFAQFLYLGMAQVGTQALVKGSQDFFSLGLKAVQNDLVEPINQQLVPFLFKYNQFPIQGDYPKIVAGDPGKIDIGAILEAFAVGIQAKVLTATREDEEWIRSQMKLPELPEGEGEDIRVPEQPDMDELLNEQRAMRQLQREWAEIAKKVNRITETIDLAHLAGRL